MCKRGTVREIYIVPGPGKWETLQVDSCLATLIQLLNNNGFHTESCCCGHGGRPGHIRFKDGTEFMLMKDFKMARKVETLMGNMHGTSEKFNNAKKRRDNAK